MKNDRADRVSQEVIDFTAEISSGASDGVSARYEAVAGANFGPFSETSDSGEAKFSDMLIEVEAKEGSGSESSYSWASAHGFSIQSESNMEEESVASYDTELRQEPANVHVAEHNPLVFLANQRWDE